MTTVTANRFIRILFTVLLCVCLVLTAWAFSKAIMFGVISLMITADLANHLLVPRTVVEYVLSKSSDVIQCPARII